MSLSTPIKATGSPQQATTAGHLSPVWARYTDLIVTSGEGAYLIADTGRRYLDFTSGIGVTNTGHCHPRVVAAAQQQVGQLIHGQANIVRHQPLIELANKLAGVMPSVAGRAALDTFFFSNSGAEAIEGALKLARCATGRQQIIAFQGGFHGRTVGALGVTSSNSKYRKYAGAVGAGVSIAPYRYCYRCAAHSADGTSCCQTGLPAIRTLLATNAYPEDVAAILIEPVLGEGGYIVPPPGFLSELRALCDEHGILLIIDEVQTGFGRTGAMWACQHEGVMPDIMVMAKGLASGFPLSGIAAPAALMDRWTPGTHGGTYGGNAVACAAALATLDVIQDQGLVQNAATQGETLLALLRDVQSRYPSIGDVRGRGLMIAVEFVGHNKTPDGATVSRVLKRCTEKGLLLLSCGSFGQVIRFIPPLIVTAEQITEAVRIFEEALAEIVQNSN